MSYGPHLQLDVLVGERSVIHHTSMSSEIVHRANKHGLAGASVFRGVEGFGHAQHIHERRVMGFDDMPMVVTIVDTEARIREFLPQLDDIIARGALVSVHPVEMLSAAIGRR